MDITDISMLCKGLTGLKLLKYIKKGSSEIDSTVIGQKRVLMKVLYDGAHSFYQLDIE